MQGDAESEQEYEIDQRLVIREKVIEQRIQTEQKERKDRQYVRRDLDEGREEFENEPEDLLPFPIHFGRLVDKEINYHESDQPFPNRLLQDFNSTRLNSPMNATVDE